MLESRRVRQFLAVYELGSIGKAAEKLLLTQPALSKSIRQLEDELGVRLFDRTAIGVTPTVFGSALAMHAKAIEAHVRQAEAAIAGMQGRARGHVRIGIGPSLATNIMPAVTIMLRRLHPELELTVTEGLVDELIPALRRNELDVAVGAWPRITDVAFATELLVCDVIDVVARVSHPLAGKPVTLDLLIDHDWALPPATQRWRQQLEEIFFAQGLAAPRPSVTSNSSNFLIATIRASDTLSFLPRQLIGAKTGLTTIAVQGMPRFEPEITMSYRERSLGDPARMEVVQAFRAVAAEISRDTLAAHAG